MKGFDFNGVVDTDQFEVGSEDIIITGNTILMSVPVLAWLAEHGVSCPVFFNPDAAQAYNREAAGRWKASVLAVADVDAFYEDDPVQAAIIREKCPSVNVVMV